MKSNIFCPVCGSPSTHSLGKFHSRDYQKSESFEYHKCSVCNLIFLYPLPTEDVINRFYEYKFAEGNYRDYERFNESKQRSFDTIITREIIPNIDRKGHILEFGCGEGFFLERLFHFGFENIWGVDVSQVAISRAQQKLPNRYKERLFCHNEDTLSHQFESQSMDCVVGLDVLEHLRSPLSFLNEAFNILSPDGLLILTTPRLNSFASKVLKLRWHYFIPLEHIHLFSSNSIKMALVRVGFQKIIVLKEKRYFSIGYSVSSLEAIYRFRGKVWRSVKVLLKGLEKLIPGVNLDVGLMTVLAKKG